MRLPNRREVRGKLHQLSTTGGLMHVEQPLDEKLKIELIFQLGETTIHEKAEIMFPMWATQGWLQPFRFVDLPEASKNALQVGLQSFVQGVQPATEVATESSPGIELSRRKLAPILAVPNKCYKLIVAAAIRADRRWYP